MRDLPRDIRLSAFYDRLNIEIGANNRAKQHVSKYDARSLFIFLASFRLFSPLSASEHPRHPNCYHFYPPEISVNRELKWGKSPTFDPFPPSHRALELRKIERKQAIWSLKQVKKKRSGANGATRGIWFHREWRSGYISATRLSHFRRYLFAFKEIPGIAYNSWKRPEMTGAGDGAEINCLTQKNTKR